MFKAYKAVLRDKKGIYTNGMNNVKNKYWKKNIHYKIGNELILCKDGIHYFKYLCFAINYLQKNNEIWEVEIHGDTIEDAFKGCTNDIVFIKKISKKEINKRLENSSNSGHYNSGNYNSGDYNSGNYNSGNRNSGHYNLGNCNSGNYNSGNYNLGNCNSGNYNSGNYNSGHSNSGHSNSGHSNSGHYNSGNYNSGHYNSGNYNSGNGYINIFCTEKKYFLFDIEVKKIPDQLLIIDMSWFNLANKTYKEAWANCPKKILDILKNIPEFKTKEAKEKFKIITGLEL